MEGEQKSKKETFRKQMLIVLFVVAIIIIRSLLSKFLSDTMEKALILEDYKGPILPLSVISKENGITAERNINLDFSFYEKIDEYEEADIRKVKVKDSYILKNTTKEEITIKAVYPFAGKLEDKVETLPIISVNGEEQLSNLVVGRDCGHYFENHKNSEDTDVDIDKLALMLDRESYVKLLSDGTYRQEAFEEIPDLNQKVKVYKLKNLGYDGEVKEEMRPMVKLQYTLDKEKTIIFTYHAKIFGGQENTQYEYYDLPIKGEANYGEDAYMVVLGQEIENLEVVYWDDRWNELLKDVSVEIETYEITLGEIVWQILSEERDLQFEKDKIVGKLNDERIFDSCKQFLYDIGAIDGKVGITFDDLLMYYSFPKVMYQTFDVTIPAFEGVEVVATFERPESVVEYDRKECRTYDIATMLGSDIMFTKQTLSLTGSENITFMEQTTGEDLENGVTEVELNLGEDFDIWLLSK